MKEKQEASDWPSWCRDKDGQVIPEKQDQYIHEYEKRESIKLDSSKIEYNPGRRFIAKLMLNSFWGKFAQRTNMNQTQIITEPEEYFKVMNDASKEIAGDEMLNENTLLLNWKYVREEDARHGVSNTIIAAYYTAYARLDLLSKMNEIESEREGRVLYFDTDSIIFEHRTGDKPIETGDFLGQLTDEIEKDYGSEARGIEFVSGGPKNYAVKTRLPNGEEVVSVKAKGITLTRLPVKE